MDIQAKRTINLEQLIVQSGFPCVSIFIQNSQPWPENKRAMIAFKNQVKKVRQQLQDVGCPQEEINSLLDPVEPWASEADMWRTVSDNMAFFISKDYSTVYTSEIPFVDSAHVGHYFDVRAILPLRLFKDFYLLKLSQEKVALYDVKQSSHKEVPVPDMPSSMAEYNRFEDREKTLQNYSFSQVAASDTAMFHGQGGAKDFDKMRLEQFAMTIATSISKCIKNKTKPMAIVGLVPLLSMFKEHSSYPSITDVIEKDPNSISTDRLIEAIRKVEYQGWLNDNNQHIKNIMNNNKKLAGAEKDISNIIKRAQEGRVSELFIRKQDYVWGKYLSLIHI